MTEQCLECGHEAHVGRCDKGVATNPHAREGELTTCVQCSCVQPTEHEGALAPEPLTEEQMREWVDDAAEGRRYTGEVLSARVIRVGHAVLRLRSQYVRLREWTCPGCGSRIEE